ncbi:MAG: TetR family transcriptional regulator, partial [Deltaproteobacteria bacterium]|nr:TetR family transcriptional regulator [Deltaproteobacteria bacterium]
HGIATPLKKFYTLIESFVIEGQEEGAIDAAINANIARKLIFGCFDEVISCWVLSRRQYDVKERIDDVLYLLHRALVVEGAA